MAELTADRDSWKAKYDAINGEHSGYKQKYTDLEAKHTALSKEMEAHYEAAAKTYADGYKERHKDIIADPVKRTELVSLLDQGWDDEAAAQLVGTSSQLRERALALVAEHGLKGTGHRLAVQQAKAELGRKGNESSTSALLTAGARGTVNPSHKPANDIRGLSRDDARHEAARLALVHSKR
jgi:hypothetical protein